MLRGHMRNVLPLWQELVPTSADRRSHSKAGSQGCDWPRHLGGERWVPSGAGRTCPTDPKPEPPCQTTTGALNVLGDLPLTPAFGPSHTEASRNLVVWGIAQTALCGVAGTLDPRGFCICAFAYSPSVHSASFMDRRRARRQLLVARRACSSRGQAG